MNVKDVNELGPGKKIAILGFGETWREAPFGDKDVTIIGLNELYKYLPRWDEWVEIHDEDSIGLTHRAIGQVEAEVQKHREWLSHDHGNGKVIWMQRRFCDGRFPNAAPYPIEEIQKQLSRFNNGQPWDYWTSTVAYAIALAMCRGRDENLVPIHPDYTSWIGMYGIELIGHGEYAHQKPCAELMLGIAMGLGIETYIPKTSALMKTDHMYGFERPKEGPVSSQLIMARIGRLRQIRDDHARGVYMMKGAIGEMENWQTYLEGIRRGGDAQLPDGFLLTQPQKLKDESLP